MCPVSPHILHARVPRIAILRYRFSAALGLILGHVRLLCPISPQTEQIRTPSTRRLRSTTRSGCRIGQVCILCPGSSQWEQNRWPLRRFFFIFSGCITGQVRLLCPNIPHTLHKRRPSRRGDFSLSSLRAAPAGFFLGHVRELCPLFPQIGQDLVNRFLSRLIRRPADSGLVVGQVLTLCPT